ncbi:hypothetical protein EI42_05684 [Thermosporothrix hazakensis]|uniref:Uncharacterized protein n=1 Tax=Thermosporothrix hazakensis TaxID=644383 RepID=A0A326TZ18_THEHA|nr:hypothetical protein EI42_05684 [Thermosporothrix hazakensis]
MVKHNGEGQPVQNREQARAYQREVSNVVPRRNCMRCKLSMRQGVEKGTCFER